MTETPRKPWRAGIIAAVVTFSVLASTVGSWAYWTASTATATLGVGAATLTSTATGWSTTTLGNETISAASSNTLVSTGSITITNTTVTTSTSSQSLSATFSQQSGSSVLAGNTTLRVWPVASTAACTSTTVPSGGGTGTWLAGVTVTATLAPNGTGSQVFCMRNTVTDRQSVAAPAGTLTFVPQVAAKLTSGTNFEATAVTTSSISTQYIFPLDAISGGYWYNIIRAGTTWCLDVSGSGTTNGSLLISYGCKNNGDQNQDFRFLDNDGDNYMDIQPRHASNLRVAAASSQTSGTAVDMRTAATTSGVQEWQPQLVAANTYQFVNQNSGLCLSAPTVSTGVTTQVTCNGGADQKFTLAQRGVIQLTSVVCSNYGGNGSGMSVQYTWAADYTTDDLTFQAKRSNATNWTPLGTSPGGTGGVFQAASPIGAPFTNQNGTYNIRVLNSNGDVVGTSSATVSNSFFGFGYDYARC